MAFYVPKRHRRKRSTVLVGKNKNRYYFADRDYYRNVYLKSDHWRELRKRKLELNPLCEKCGGNNCVDPHHLLYRNLYDVQLSDLQTLCRKCHAEVHTVMFNQSSIHKKRRIRVTKIFRKRQEIIERVAKTAKMSRQAVEIALNDLLYCKRSQAGRALGFYPNYS
jgi:5-methylcytosine-specific restriction endonuclease McrA